MKQRKERGNGSQTGSELTKEAVTTGCQSLDPLTKSSSAGTNKGLVQDNQLTAPVNSVSEKNYPRTANKQSIRARAFRLRPCTASTPANNRDLSQFQARGRVAADSPFALGDIFSSS